MQDQDFFRLVLGSGLDLDLHVDTVVILLALAVLLILLLIRWRLSPRMRRFEIDQAEFGLGDQKITIKPNTTDLQIAYKIWVELSTRKIGLPIDLEHDVLTEVYDSWFAFFGVTREHIKDVPATRFRRKDTEQIIRLSIDVLNCGVRPHLTRWQARFRRWYDRELLKEANNDKSPQEIQSEFPFYEDLVADLKKVNGRLIRYRQRMYEIVSGS